MSEEYFSCRRLTDVKKMKNETILPDSLKFRTNNDDLRIKNDNEFTEKFVNESKFGSSNHNCNNNNFSTIKLCSSSNRGIMLINKKGKEITSIIEDSETSEKIGLNEGIDGNKNKDKLYDEKPDSFIKRNIKKIKSKVEKGVNKKFSSKKRNRGSKKIFRIIRVHQEISG